MLNIYSLTEESIKKLFEWHTSKYDTTVKTNGIVVNIDYCLREKFYSWIYSFTKDLKEELESSS
jgi:hypothetical protein